MFNYLNRFKKKIALVGENDEKISYQELLKKTNLLNKKIKKKSLVLLIAKNSIDSICGYVCFLKNNHPTILADQNFDNKYLEQIIKSYSPKYIFCEKKSFLQKKIYKKIYAVNNFSLYQNTKYKKKFINRKNSILLSTSGSTNNPKFVRISKDSLNDNSDKIIRYLNISSKDTTITTMPMAYSFGLSIINTHLKKGARIVVNNNTIFEKFFWNKIIKYKITSFGGVPKFYEYLEKLKFEKFNLKNLKYLTQAGGKLQNSQYDYLNKICKSKNIKFFVMYGQTEASPRMSYLNPKKFMLKKGSIGKPLTNSNFYLIDENYKKIKKPFVEGELIFKGKNVFLGYAKNINDLQKGDENNQILYTGDLAYKDKDNYYFISGRKNRFIKLYGIRFDLDDIEKILSKNKIDVNCNSENDKLVIISKNKHNFNEMKIRKIMNDNFRIRNDEIIFKNNIKRILTNFKK